MFKDLCDKYTDTISCESNYESIGKSIQGRDIWLFKFGNPKGGRVMWDGSGHGPEDAGTEAEYLFAKWTLESNEPEAKKVLEGNYLLFIPVLNIDSNGARQNLRRQYVLDNGTVINVPYGVDLNRNAVTGWEGSGSGDPNNDYEYRGLYGGSEPETQAYRFAMSKYKPQFYVNTHFGGAYALHKNSTLYSGIDNNFTIRYNNLTTALGVAKYPITGGLAGGYIANDGWSYGASAWLIEFADWTYVDTYVPTYNQFVTTLYPRIFPILLAMCQAVENPVLNNETKTDDWVQLVIDNSVSITLIAGASTILLVILVKKAKRKK
jgi:hypothetical protein